MVVVFGTRGVESHRCRTSAAVGANSNPEACASGWAKPDQKTSER
jgi:hypothetical protein